MRPRSRRRSKCPAYTVQGQATDAEITPNFDAAPTRSRPTGEGGTPMKYAVMSFQTDFSVRPDELAPAVEARGFESLWFPDHSHIPASRRTPHPQGIELPKDYWHLLDPFGCINAAAAVTKRLKLGTGVLLVCERDPITTAKQVATADFLS